MRFARCKEPLGDVFKKGAEIGFKLEYMGGVIQVSIYQPHPNDFGSITMNGPVYILAIFPHEFKRHFTEFDPIAEAV